VVHGDGTTHDPGEFDAAFINAGVTKIPSLWLNRMRDGARLLVPFTVDGNERPGWMILIRRDGDQFSARPNGFAPKPPN
jgi:protein-L-isoaspartate O-methyltransferase